MNEISIIGPAFVHADGLRHDGLLHDGPALDGSAHGTSAGEKR
jgi:hypothetical protein